MTMKQKKTVQGGFGVAFLVALAVATSSITLYFVENAKAAPPAKLAPLTLSCNPQTTDSVIVLNVCAGATGAPAGFSIQWMTCAAFDSYTGPREKDGWPTDESAYCKASFSGQAHLGQDWSLAPNGCVTVPIGGLEDLATTPSLGVSSTCTGILECGTCYVFRAFAHNVPGPGGLNRSDYSYKMCSTAPCAPPEVCCLLSHGYYKHQCEAGTYTGPETIQVGGCATLNVCNEVTNEYTGGGPENALYNAKGKLGYQIITIKLDLLSCTGTPPEGLLASLATAESVYCDPKSTVPDFGTQNAILTGYIDEYHCPE